MALLNVLGLNARSVHNDIMMFLGEREEQSDNTRISYETDIKQFFLFVRHKNISELIISDIEELERHHFFNFRSHMKSLKKKDGETPKYVARSINRKIKTMYSLLTYLKVACKYNLDIESLRLQPLPEVDSKMIGWLEWEDAVNMAMHVRNLHENGYEKSVIFLLNLQTSIRKSAILQLKWRNVYLKDGIPVIDVYDKGNKHLDPSIPEELYDQILKLKKEDSKEDGFVFSIRSPTTLNNMMNQLKVEFNLPEDITFHSIKKTGVRTAYIESGFDIKIAQQQAHHSSSKTTQDVYLPMIANYAEKPSYWIGKKIDKDEIVNELAEMTHEELYNLVNKFSRAVLVEIANKLKK